MHRLERPEVPDEFKTCYEAFVQDYPPANPERTETKRWEAWKNEYRDAYKAVLKRLWENQYGLCAFCEVKMTETNRQIEHFIPKCKTTPEHDWTINFGNYTLACKGNTYRYDETSYSNVPSEEANYSCGHKKGEIDPDGVLCNPYDLPPYPVVKAEYEEEGLRFVPDDAACAKAHIAPALIASTLENLGLNCPNLMRRRKEVWDKLMKKIEKVFSSPDMDEQEQKEELSLLVEDNLQPFNGTLVSFYTTRLLCLASDLPELIEG